MARGVSRIVRWLLRRPRPPQATPDLLSVTMYGAPWCGDCHRSRRLLDQRGIRYDWIDVDQDEQALAYIQRLQDGGRRIPTIVFGDGTWLAEPTNPQLEAKLASLGSTDGRNGVRSAG